MEKNQKNYQFLNNYRFNWNYLLSAVKYLFPPQPANNPLSAAIENEHEQNDRNILFIKKKEF